MRFGYKLIAEGSGPAELMRQAIRAERAGFDLVEISDDYHPWLDTQGHSPFAWTVLGAIAAQTERIGLATGVICPTTRYHPAIVAQAAATLQIVSGNRFTLGVGAGERLNKHVVGTGFPSVRGRNERLREALEIIRLLWGGGYHSYEGNHLQLQDAGAFDLPDRLPPIVVAGSGAASATLAAELGDGLFAVEPDADLVDAYQAAGGKGVRYGEVALAWADDEEHAVQAALATSRRAVTGWKVVSELPNPVNFEAAAQTVTADDIRSAFAVGPDVEVHVAAVKKYVDAGFDHLVLMNAGPDPDGFLDFFASELGPRLRAL